MPRNLGDLEPPGCCSIYRLGRLTHPRPRLLLPGLPRRGRVARRAARVISAPIGCRCLVYSSSDQSERRLRSVDSVWRKAARVQGGGQDGGGVTARRANGKRGRAAAVANGERGTRCHVPRLRGSGGAVPGLGRDVLYWVNWERPGGGFTPFLRLLPAPPWQPGGASTVRPPGYLEPPPVNPLP